MRSCLILTILSILLPHAVSAEPLFIDQSRRIDFVPDEAFFIVEYDQQTTLRVAATLLAPTPQGGGPGDRSVGRWFAGARIDPPEGTRRISYGAIFIGKGNRYEFVPVEQIVVAERPAFRSSREALRALIEERKAVLGSWRVQMSAQDESARRLRADAEVIGEFGRIIEKKQEIDRAKQEIVNVVRDIDNLERFLKLTNSSAKPVNFVAREGQLTRQISELAAAAKTAELQEVRRRSHSAGDLQRRLALIEETRNDDLAALEAELGSLRQNKAKQGT